MKTIKQSNTFNATPKDLYDWFMDSKKHSRFTGANAKIGKKVGDKFTVWDGYAGGVNKRLIPGKLIVQSWRENDWEEGEYSEAKFEFIALEKKTKLVFTQSGIPDDRLADLKQGWIDYYWDPLRRALG